MGHQISHTVVGELLKEQKFSLQGNRKTKEGSANPDRDAQFHHINTSVTEALAAHQPVLSVDTKKDWSATSRTVARMASSGQTGGSSRA